MNDMEELEIARRFGTPSYLVYRIIKSLGGTATKRDIVIESGLSERTINPALKTLKAYGLVTIPKTIKYNANIYTTTDTILY